MHLYVLAIVLIMLPHYLMASMACGKLNSAKDIIECATIKSPGVQRAYLNYQSLEALPLKSGAYSNPELEVESLDKETEISLTQSLDLGHIKQARIKLSQKQIAEVEIEKKSVVQDLKIQTMLNLHRLRQLDAEKSIVQQIVKAISSTLLQLKRRQALTPEQTVSITLYQLALAETNIKLSEIADEEIVLEKFFLSNTGVSLFDLSRILPSSPEIFPVIHDVYHPGKSLIYLNAMATEDLAFAELDLEKQEASPILSLGPIAKLEKDDEGKNDITIGFKFSMDLPVFDRNKYGIALATAQFSKSKKMVNLALEEENIERKQLLKNYQNAVSSLKETPKLSEISSTLLISEALEKRGLIASSLLIEGYRLQFDLLKSRHGRELSALESLYKIEAIDGKLFEGIL